MRNEQGPGNIVDEILTMNYVFPIITKKNTMKISFLVILITFCCTIILERQKVIINSESSFEKITFQSTACYGFCPDISMNLYSDKRIEVARAMYNLNDRGVIDSSLSGKYEGYLTDNEFKKLIEVVNHINWDTIKFPQIFCCDGPVKTIVISYKTKHIRFKSMQPPKETNELFSYLVAIGSRTSLKKSGKTFTFEYL